MKLLKALVEKLFTPVVSDVDAVRKSFAYLFPHWIGCRDLAELVDGLWSKGLPRYKAEVAARFLLGEDQLLSRQDLRLIMRTLLILEV